jgi:hypothetical protein
VTKTGGILAATVVSGNATVRNTGSNLGGNIDAIASGVGNATVTNSGTNINGNIIARTGGGGGGSGDAFVNNSGRNIGGTILAITTGVGNAAVINSGVAEAGINPKTKQPFDAIDVVSFFGNATLTNVVGARVFGNIVVDGAAQFVNYLGGNWLQTIALGSGNTALNANGAPFVAVPTALGIQVAVLDATTFALADRALVNFTGQIGQMLQGRFAGMSVPGAGGRVASGFAAVSGSEVADQAQAAFAGIPSVAMSYASSDSRPIIGQGGAGGSGAVLRHHRLGLGLWRRTQAARRWLGAADDRHRLWRRHGLRSHCVSQSAARRVRRRRRRARASRARRAENRRHLRVRRRLRPLRLDLAIFRFFALRRRHQQQEHARHRQ